MGRTLAGVDLGATIQGVMGGDPLTLRQVTDGAQPSDPNEAPARVNADHPCSGYPSAVRRSAVPDSLVRQKMTIFGIYGNTLPAGVEPDEHDFVIDGDGHEYEVYATDVDSAEGVWILYTTWVR